MKMVKWSVTHEVLRQWAHYYLQYFMNHVNKLYSSMSVTVKRRNTSFNKKNINTYIYKSNSVIKVS